MKIARPWALSSSSYIPCSATMSSLSFSFRAWRFADRLSLASARCEQKGVLCKGWAGNCRPPQAAYLVVPEAEPIVGGGHKGLAVRQRLLVPRGNLVALHAGVGSRSRQGGPMRRERSQDRYRTHLGQVMAVLGSLGVLGVLVFKPPNVQRLHPHCSLFNGTTD